MENFSKGRQQLLRMALMGNALFSTISGLTLILAGHRVVRLLGLPEAVNLLTMGISLLVVAVTLVVFARKKTDQTPGCLDRSPLGSRVGHWKLPASLCGALQYHRK